MPGPVGRAGVGGGGGSEPALVHGGRRQGLGPVHGASAVCGENRQRGTLAGVRAGALQSIY